MLNIFNRNDDNDYESTGHSPMDDEKKVQIATCALFIEIAKADYDFAVEEREKIIAFMKKCFNLDDNEVLELMKLAEKKVDESVSIYEFSAVINKHFSDKDKFDLMKNLWRLIYVDNSLHMYEDNMIKKIGGTLNFSHKRIIEAKMLVREELGL